MLIKITSTVVELSAFGAALSVTDEMMECHLSLPVLRMSYCPRYNITLPGGGGVARCMGLLLSEPHISERNNRIYVTLAIYCTQESDVARH